MSLEPKGGFVLFYEGSMKLEKVIDESDMKDEACRPAVWRGFLLKMRAAALVAEAPFLLLISTR